MFTSTGNSNKMDSNVTGSKKKLVIVPFKNKPQLPDNFESLTWTKLEAAVCAVNTNIATIDISKEELYQAVADVCLHKLAPSVYTKLSVLCEKYVFQKVDSLTTQTQRDHFAFLCLVDDVWRSHCDHILTIRNIFLYMDRSYALPTHGIKSIWDLGIQDDRHPSITSGIHQHEKSSIDQYHNPVSFMHKYYSI